MINPIASRRPNDDESTTAYHRSAIQSVKGDCVLKALDQQLPWLGELAANVSPEQTDKVHPPYQWTIRQVLEHCTSAERVFGYRMLRLAAGDQTSLPGWDENAYADSRFGLGNLGHIVSEMESLRRANTMLLRRIVPQAWDRSANVDGGRLTVRAIAWLAAGHLQHHLVIVEQRCGLSLTSRAGCGTC